MEPTLDSLDALELVLGDATPLTATVYARLPSTDEFARGRLSGVVQGPHCALSSMLPADYRLVDCGPGPTRLARAVVPDPCYWSADLPALYDVTVTWTVDGQTRATWHREFGLRRLGTRGRHFWFEGRRWVLRGVDRSNSAIEQASAWRELAAVCVTESCDSRLVASASREGIPLVADVSNGECDVAAMLRRLARWPALMAMLVKLDASQTEAWAAAKNAASGVLLVQRVESATAVARQADALLVSAERLQQHSSSFLTLDRPIVAWRPAAAVADLETARAACDGLQRDLASTGDFAGYLVSGPKAE